MRLTIKGGLQSRAANNRVNTVVRIAEPGSATTDADKYKMTYFQPVAIKTTGVYCMASPLALYF